MKVFATTAALCLIMTLSGCADRRVTTRAADAPSAPPREERTGMPSRAAHSLDALSRAVNSEQADEALRHLADSAAQLEAALGGVKARLPELLDRAEREAEALAADLRASEAEGRAADRAEGQVLPALEALRILLAGARGGAQTLGGALRDLERMTDDAEVRGHLGGAMRELEGAAASLRELAESLRDAPKSPSSDSFERSEERP